MNTAEVPTDSPGISPELLKHLSETLTTIQGLPYLFARSSYGDELTLHFGTERGYNHPKLSGKVRGTHVLNVRGSAWLLRSGIKPVMVGSGVYPILTLPGRLKPFNVTALESGALIGQGATIKQVIPFEFDPFGHWTDRRSGRWVGIRTPAHPTGP